MVRILLILLFLREGLYAALGTDREHMAGALSQRRVHSAAENIQQVKGDKRLHRARKAAAVNPERAPALEIMLTQCQADRHILMLLVPGGHHIL